MKNYLAKIKEKFNREEAQHEREYVISIVLDYVKRNAGYFSNDYFQPSYFNEELKIGDLKRLINRLTKQGLLSVNELGLVYLTEEGNRFLDEREDYVAFFNLASPYVKFKEYRKSKERTEGENRFETAMIKLFLRKLKEYQANNDYVAVKNIHFDLANLYGKVGYNESALYHYLICLYFDVNGMEYYEKFLGYMNKKLTKKELYNSFEYFCINPALNTSIKKFKEAFDISVIDKVYEENEISLVLCNKEKFAEIVDEILGNRFYVKKWQEYFWTRFKAMATKIEETRGTVKKEQ